ncbi:MAG: PCRF domain-containing protein, partial [Clostridia bacterium]|nr:PCRF domain-containing protein [Clostridia bacterium]
MFERLEKMRLRFIELNELIAKPEIVARQDEWQKLVKEHAALQPVVEEYENYLRMEKEMT